jgi:phytoene dehydrogenase-like protein
MTTEPFDVVVVGAGLAGLCCAGELVLHGKRPLLVCETSEVGHTIQSVEVAGNFGVPQAATRATGWGGGSWFMLARRLNVPLRLFPDGGLALTIVAGDTPSPVVHMPVCASASAFTDMLISAGPWPLESIRHEFESLFTAALAIPWEELVKMERVSLGEWMADQKVSETAELIITLLLSQILLQPLEDTRHQTSVSGGIGCLRSYICGEGALATVYPDNRRGIAIPIAEAVERMGGEVWRGRKVATIDIARGSVSTVVLEDGTEIQAPVVAMAAGNSRIRKLLDPVPPEVVEAPQSTMRDFYTYTALDRPVVDPGPVYMAMMDPSGTNLLWTWPMHALAPWSTKPGQQMIVAASAVSEEQLLAAGGEEGLHKRMNDLHELYYPGFLDSIVEQKTNRHTHLWFDQMSVRPKLPRRSPSVGGLWYVGEGSTPQKGFGFEAAASAGVLGGQEIARALNSPLA